jgi:hypothetical protein
MEKFLIILFGHLWVVELTYIYKLLPSNSLEGVCSLILFPLFATGVVDTGGKFAPVSTTLAKLVAKFAAGVVDTGGKFAVGVIDTGSNFAAGPNLKRS